MKSTSVARQAIMHDVCNAPYVADCPADGCGKCRFNGLKPKEPYVRTCFLPKGEDCKGGACDGCHWYKPNRDKLAELKEEVEKKREEVRMYEGHGGFMNGVKSYGDHCRSTESVCTPKSFEVSVINGITHLLQDYIRRGICEVNVDEWDDHVLVQVIVYDDVVKMERYRTVNKVLPDSVSSAKSDNHNYKQLPKPIRILVELGSKDSVEYKNSEEYKKEQANKTEKQQMTNQLMLTQVRLVYEYLHDEATRCKNGSAPLSLLSHQHVLETARNGLFMVIRDTLGEGYDDDNEHGQPLPPSEEPEKLEEHLRYCGEAMLKDDIVRHSMYDLSDAKFNVGPVDFAGYLESIDPEDNVPTWRARAVFTVGDYDVQFWFKFDEKGSAIANSVKAFDKMLESLPFTRFALTKKSYV